MRDQLMEARHRAYLRAREVNFQPGAITQEWRTANQNYVRARDGQEPQPQKPVRRRKRNLSPEHQQAMLTGRKRQARLALDASTNASGAY